MHGAVEWAEGRCGDRTYTLYACADVDGLGLIRLAGVDPSAEQASEQGVVSSLEIPSDLPEGRTS